MVVPNQIREGVFVEGMIVRPNKGIIPVKILNTRDESVRLRNFNSKLSNLGDCQLCNFKEIIL